MQIQYRNLSKIYSKKTNKKQKTIIYQNIPTVINIIINYSFELCEKFNEVRQ